MEHGHGLMLRDALLILGFALVAVLAFRRAGLGATLGYLVAGALLGPHVFGLGFAQVTACGLAVTATVLALTGYPLAAAFAIGLRAAGTLIARGVIGVVPFADDIVGALVGEAAESMLPQTNIPTTCR